MMDMFRNPDGSIDFDLLGAVLDEANIPPEQWQATMDEYARIYGKSMDDLMIEFINSGALSESETRDAMKMLGTFPKSKYSRSKN